MKFYSLVEQAVHKSVSEPRIGGAAVTRMIDAHAFAVLLVKFIQNQVEKGFLQKEKMEERLVKLAKTVDEKKSKHEKISRQRKSTWFDPQGHQRICPTTRVPIKNRTVHQYLQMIRISVIIEDVAENGGSFATGSAVNIAPQRKVKRTS